MASKTVVELLGEIKAEFERFDAVALETHFLQARIDAEFEELDQFTDRQDSVSLEIINEHTRLLKKNAHETDQSNLSDEHNMVDEVKALQTKAIQEGLSDEDVPRLERFLEKLKRATELKAQLRVALVELLDEARNLKTRADRSEPKA